MEEMDPSVSEERSISPKEDPMEEMEETGGTCFLLLKPITPPSALFAINGIFSPKMGSPEKAEIVRGKTGRT